MCGPWARGAAWTQTNAAVVENAALVFQTETGSQPAALNSVGKENKADDGEHKQTAET